MQKETKRGKRKKKKNTLHNGGFVVCLPNLKLGTWGNLNKFYTLKGKSDGLASVKFLEKLVLT